MLRSEVALVVAVALSLVAGCKEDGGKNDMGMDSDGAVVESDLAGVDGPEIVGDGGGGLDAAACATACSLGAKSCDGNGVRTCVQAGSCTEWSTAVPCGGGGVCSGGLCVGSCKNQCDQGATYCSQNGFRTCAVSVGGCTDWSSTVTPCTNNAVCSGGVCAASCIDRCTAGQTQCSGFGVQSCERKFSKCLDWSDPRPCETGKVCSGGACVAMCSDVCTVGDKKCAGTDSIQECKKAAATGCNDFVLPQVCASGGACSAGACQTCTEMSKRCSPQGNVEMCTSGSFLQIAACAFGCTSGACTSMVSCTPGSARCNGNSVEICNSTGSAFLFSTTCANGCASGLCLGACTNGVKRCNDKTPETCTNGSFVAGTACTTFCEDGICALDSLTVSSAQDLNGLVLVAGAVNVSGSGVITSSTGDLTIRADTIVINDGATINIAATGDGVTGRGNAGHPSSTTCGGSGGGHGSQGQSNCFSGGVVHGSALDISLEKGAPGGAGGSATVLGGKGGGILRLIARTSITMACTISVKGESGQGTSNGFGGGGGGSGGSVLIASDQINITGAINASGGSGGITTAGGSNGGGGGNGRVKILHGSMVTINGPGISGATAGMGLTTGIMPPLKIASSTHPISSLTYNNGAPAFGVAWERPYSGTQGYYQLLSKTPFTAVNQLPNPSNTTGLVRPDLISLDPASLTTGLNIVHLVSMNAMSVFGEVENTFSININTAPPTLSSDSHMNQTTFSQNHDVFFNWISPIADANLSRYYFVLDQFGDTIPDGSATPLPITQKQQLFTQPDGIWAFHIITADTQGYFTKGALAASHRQVRIGPNPSPDPGLGTIQGNVDEMTGTGIVPVQGATVTINRGLFNIGTETTPDVVTATDGSFTFPANVPANFPGSQPQWELRATKAGYMPATRLVTVTRNATTTVAPAIRLTKLP